MNKFGPDFQNLVKAARNTAADLIPLYEHIVSFEVIEKIVGKKFPIF